MPSAPSAHEISCLLRPEGAHSWPLTLVQGDGHRPSGPRISVTVNHENQALCQDLLHRLRTLKKSEAYKTVRAEVAQLAKSERSTAWLNTLTSILHAVLTKPDPTPGETKIYNTTDQAEWGDYKCQHKRSDCETFDLDEPENPDGELVKDSLLASLATGKVKVLQYADLAPYYQSDHSGATGCVPVYAIYTKTSEKGLDLQELSNCLEGLGWDVTRPSSLRNAEKITMSLPRAWQENVWQAVREQNSKSRLQNLSRREFSVVEGLRREGKDPRRREA
ncbi:uncharacterized protein MKK02DRAFT_41648 [Dioszegia hungarica]|uniref:Uncharacterized protein n=1 Tax=Dioszegia hungarica TaxID=4972 RepID=A0AA38H3F1_9TREE|nr:uncharacterized protein MKK02DRAFT_41648 [Dioszegia hungarica]KAI9632006.1 hypothetical protein MKK02DRAFT_41648 [Dioszegia hungarica]